MLSWEVLETHYPSEQLHLYPFESLIIVCTAFCGLETLHQYPADAFMGAKIQSVLNFLQPKLFDGYKFYFIGGFIPSYKGYLQDLVITAGGIILYGKLVSDDQNSVPRHMRPQVQDRDSCFLWGKQL
ncbi:unnamed protein product [Vicia faba]|uniref:Uncharacterized protein n=1 Tax=Vicia faba TaxID=3906 RepID=A0AAV0YZ90_VICFA|nr:unnamed protein product [Vicia faba]